MLWDITPRMRRWREVRFLLVKYDQRCYSSFIPVEPFYATLRWFNV